MLTSSLLRLLLPALTLLPSAHCSPPTPIQPPPARHGTIRFAQAGNVTKATFDHPPINLLDQALISDLHDFMLWLAPAPGKATPKVVVFDSANPDYFLAHTDVRFLEGDAAVPGASDSIHRLIDIGHMLVNTTPTAFIASIDGRANGIGNELAMQMDMRFAGPNAWAVQFENSIGLAAAGGGHLFIGPAVGRAKAMEHLLASLGFDCETGKATGLFNNCYDDSDSLAAAVDNLAARIALFPQHSLNNTKFTLNGLYPTLQQQREDLERLLPLAALPSEHAIVREFVVLSGGQTKTPFEMNIPDSILQSFYNYTARDLNAGASRGLGQGSQIHMGSWSV